MDHGRLRTQDHQRRYSTHFKTIEKRTKKNICYPDKIKMRFLYTYIYKYGNIHICNMRCAWHTQNKTKHTRRARIVFFSTAFLLFFFINIVQSKQIVDWRRFNQGVVFLMFFFLLLFYVTFIICLSVGLSHQHLPTRHCMGNKSIKNVIIIILWNYLIHL